MILKNKSVYYLTQTAVIAALYAVLTIFQSVIFPESTSAAIQFRVSEALTILALYTNAAIPALTLGCVLANISSVAVLGPLDMIFGQKRQIFQAPDSITSHARALQRTYRRLRNRVFLH